MRFAGCAHATTLDLAWMRGRGTAPAGDSEDAERLQRHGDAHEARPLARLKAAGRSVVEIVKEGASLAQGVAATRVALERGAEVAFQGALAGGARGGWSYFRERVERPSALGAWSCEVTDTTLKRKPPPEEPHAPLRPSRRAPGGWRRSTPTSSLATVPGRRSACGPRRPPP
jgi:uncharacterized protein